MEKYAAINYDLSPLIVLKYGKKEPDDKEFDEHLAELKSLYTSGNPFVLLIE
jgi:hypothetical protein